MRLVSVILPTYNRKKYLQEAVGSVLQQSYAELEVIVIDGGSDDGTREWLRSREDDRLKLITHDQPRGPGIARNVGLGASSGEYIVFLDDDDRLLENAIGTLVETIRGQPQDCGGVYTAYRTVDESGNQCESRISDGKVTRFSDACINGPSCTLIRKTVVEQIGTFDESFQAREDADFWIRLFLEFHMIALDKVLYERRIHVDQLSEDNELMLRAQKQLIAKHWDHLSDRELAHRLSLVALNQAQSGQTGQARRNLRKARSIHKLDRHSLYYYFWLHLGSIGYKIGHFGANRILKPVLDISTHK